MFKRTRYQFGWMRKKTRRRGPDVWVWVYRSRRTNGTSKENAVIIGDVMQYRTEADAWRASEGIRLAVRNPEPATAVTFGALVDRYMLEKLPKRLETARTYKSRLTNHVRPRWGDEPLKAVKPLLVEEWITSLDLAPKTKGHIRSLMHILFNWAMKWELLDIDKMNPMDLVRIEGSSKCLKEIRTLSGEEFGFLLKELDQPVVRTMCIVTACLGLRVSETLGLRWGDFDWKRMQVHIQRGFVTGHVGDVKTRKSSTQLPIHPSLMKALLDYRSEMAPDASDTDWLFPSPRGTGKPRRAWSVQLRYLIPAGIRAGVGRIGWHTFRHTYSTMLRALEVDVKVQQDLLRHADIRTTMNIYTHAIPKAMRAAHGKVVDLLLPTASGEDQNRGSNRAAITVLPGSKAFRPMPASTA